MNFFVNFDDERQRALHHVTHYNSINLKQYSAIINIKKNPYNLNLKTSKNKIVYADISIHKKKFNLQNYKSLLDDIDIDSKFMLKVTNAPFITGIYTPITKQNFLFQLVNYFLNRTDELYLELSNKILYPVQEVKFKKNLKKNKEFWLQYINANSKIKYFSIATELANNNYSFHFCKPLYQDKIITDFK